MRLDTLLEKSGILEKKKTLKTKFLIIGRIYLGGDAQMMSEMKKQTLALMTMALGFVAALVWKDALKAWMAPLYADAQGAMGLTIAALVVTAVVVVITVLLAKWLGSEEESK